MLLNYEDLSPVKKSVEVEIPADLLSNEAKRVTTEFGRSAKIPGFRPGKVPMKMVVQTYGPQVRSEVLGDAVQKTFTQVVNEAKLKVAGYPRIEKKAWRRPDRSKWSIMKVEASMINQPSQ